MRAADNTPDPSRGLADIDPAAAARETEGGLASAWSRAILPLLQCARVRLLLSGRLERADGKGILWLPYRKGPKARTREVEVEVDAEGLAVAGYARSQALGERAVLPVTFGALDGKASWRDEDSNELGPHRISGLYPGETTRPALFTALRTRFAEILFRRLLTGPKYKPKRIGTDGLRSYGAATREVLPDVRHRTSRYWNNRAENSHGRTRRRDRQMPRFNSPEQAQRFLSARSMIYGHFRSRRHLMTAAWYRRARVEALRIWLQETCVQIAA